MRGSKPVCLMMAATFAMTGYSTVLVSENFETGQSAGASPVGAAVVRPTVNSTGIFCAVVGGTTNTAGSGYGVRLYDNDGAAGIGLEYGFAAQSAVKVVFSFSPVNTSGANSVYAAFGIGQYSGSTSQTLNSGTGRYGEARLYDGGRFRVFFSPSTYVNATLSAASSNTVTMYVNDYDTQSVTYAEGGATYTLPANSVAWWLNGSLIPDSNNGNAQYGSLDLAEITAGGTVGTTEGNLGRIGFSSSTTYVGLDYVVDNIEVSTIVEVPPSAYLLEVDFENDTVGNNPAANDVSPSVAAADNFLTIISSVSNKAGTGQGLRFYDNSSSVGTRLGYDFSPGVSAIRYDFSFAVLNTNGINADVVSVCVLANGASAGSGTNRYAEVRLYDNGTARFYSEGNYITGSQITLAGNTAYTISMFVNDGNTAVSYNNGANTLAANSVDYWVNGSLAASGLLFTPGTTSTAGLGRIGFSSTSTDVGIDYAFDNLKVSEITGSAPKAPRSLGLYIILSQTAVFPGTGDFRQDVLHRL